MVGRIYHVGLIVSDLDRSIAFYRDILELEFQGEIFMEGEETDKMFRRVNCKARVAYLNGSKAVEAPPVELIQFVNNEVKKFPSPKIFLYDRRLNPTGQRATFPALTASLLLKETQRTYHTGRMQTSVIKIRITTFTTSNTFDPILLFSIIYCTSLE